MRKGMKERRGSLRTKEYGMALLVPSHSNADCVAGVLIDANDRGFRVKHSYSGFRRNHVVRFIHRLREGTARVVWTRSTKRGFETGFEYLDN